jgi:DNA topoisomerase I
MKLRPLVIGSKLRVLPSNRRGKVEERSASHGPNQHTLDHQLLAEPPGGFMARILTLPVDPEKSAKAAGLTYSLAGAGYSRVRKGDSFEYLDGQKAIKDAEILHRIRSLALPPAWTDVWIASDPSAHIQATGRDARGRKQYRYHSEYRRVRDETKFGRMLAFGAALKKIRSTVEEDLRLPGLPKRKLLATIVRLLETTCIRIGNDEYAKQNNSFGLTTLKDKHVEVKGGKVRFKFKGKSGQEHDIELDDPRLAKIVKTCRDIPGYELFQYYDEQGNRSRITSTDVNEYLREITGEDFTAKDFRTWGGTGAATLALEALGAADSPTQAKKNIVDAVKCVATRLGNRPATCRKYYIHPAIVEAYIDGSLLEALAKAKGERREEVLVLQIVEKYTATLNQRKKPKSLERQLKESLRKFA